MIEFEPLHASNTDLVLGMMSDFYAIDQYPFDRARSEQLMQQFISTPHLGKGWMLRNENQIPMGYTLLTYVFSFEYGGLIAFLDELYLTPHSRGKGYGAQALAHVQNEAKKAGVKIMYLEIEPHNEVAQKLYLANGFEIHHRGILRHKIS